MPIQICRFQDDDIFPDTDPRSHRAETAHDTPELILAEVEDLKQTLPTQSRVWVVARTAQVLSRPFSACCMAPIASSRRSHGLRTTRITL